MFTWLRRAHGRTSPRQRPSPAHACRPHLETLEDRCVLAVLNEFAVPAGTVLGYGLTTGPDGNLWFTSGAALSRMTPTGSLAQFPIPSTYALDVTTGPDGNLWYTATGPSTAMIGRMTPSGAVTEFAFPPGNNTGMRASITTGPDGNLWFTWNDTPAGIGRGIIGRITPTGSITQFPLPSSNILPVDITTGPDGNLWFTEEYTVGKIGRITPGGTITEFSLPPPYDTQPFTYPNGITAGPDGNVWFTLRAVSAIGRITPAGSITLFATPTPHSTPFDITTGPDGNLWFTEYDASRIGRSTPAGSITELVVPAANGWAFNPSAITTGPDGNLWFTAPYRDNASAGDRIGQILLTPGPTPNQAPDERYVQQLYRDMLAREAEPAGLAFWTRLLAQGQSRAQVVQGMQSSPEYRIVVVTQLYARLLRRAPDPGGLQYATDFLARGGSVQQLEVILAGSPEYFVLHGGTNAGFVQGIYQDFLGRPATQIEVIQKVQLLAGGASRTRVASDVVNGLEGATVAVQHEYQRLLHRPADAPSLQYYVTALLQGMALQQLDAALLASPEYYSNATVVTNQTWVTQVYAQLLLRPPEAAGLAFWTGLLSTGTATPYQVALQIASSPEGEAVFVQQQYLHYLGVGADPDGLRFGAAFLTQGGTRAQYLSLLAGSPLYYQQHGGTDASFLGALYLDALGRPIDPAGLAAFSQALASGATRTQVAAVLFSSDEYRTRLVQGYYGTLLGRAADPAGLAAWTHLLGQGGRDEQVAAGLLSSDEFFARLANV